jgi:DNA invertase Pin-like site-specific DNA recombinase
MTQGSKTRHIKRTVALCYIRQSQTRDENDMDSPDRQRANIQIACDQNGWAPEWYEDAEGHKSGTKVTNRPGWMALHARLGDPDVAALVANDLARLHRKGWRVGELLDFVDEHGVKLVLAAPGKQMDFSTPQGRIVAQLSAIFDEWYAVDIAQRAKDSISHRKRRGITVGLPPFGTVRDDNGYLTPSGEGARLPPDRTYATGNQHKPPMPRAIWRGYFECAEYILKSYAINRHGIDAIAYKMQTEGWPFRDRHGNPRPIHSEDIRRVISNWAEYGGHVSQRRARERHALDLKIDKIDLIEERSVFPVELLYRVAQVRRERSIRRPVDHGYKPDNFPYPALHYASIVRGWQRNTTIRSSGRD